MRRVALIWITSRIAVFVAATYSTWVLAGSASVVFGSDPDSVPQLGPIGLWNQWDLQWYASIARDGYGATGFENNYAFPPGFPALLWLLGKVNIHVTLAGLVIALVAGLAAALALSQLTERLGGTGELAVGAWVLAPSAVYLAAPYTEALFCAFAFTAWLAAGRQRWLTASLLASAACLVRVNGLFLAAALVVLFLTRRSVGWRHAGWLLLPFFTLAAVLAYFRLQTGSWTTWLDAQADGWGRHFTNPWDTLVATYNYAFNIGLSATYNIQYKAELAAMAVIIGLAIVMLVKRWWGEATYVLLTALSLGTSTLYYSVPRAALVLFPVWMLLGVWMTRHRWLAITYVTVATPLMFVGVIGFVNGRWIA